MTRNLIGPAEIRAADWLIRVACGARREPCTVIRNGLSHINGSKRALTDGVVVDLVTVSEAVAGLLAAGGVKELGETAGGGLMAGMIERVRKVFGSDARSVDALEQARQDGSSATVAELASALAWHARRDHGFAEELTAWAARADGGAVTQHNRAGRDVNAPIGNQTVVNYHVAPGD
jgi:hypothetical protein